MLFVGGKEQKVGREIERAVENRERGAGNKERERQPLPSVRVRVAGGSIGWESREARKNWRKKVGKAKIGGGKIGEENWERELGIGHDKMHESRRSHCRGLDRTRYTTIGVVNTVTARQSLYEMSSWLSWSWLQSLSAPVM